MSGYRHEYKYLLDAPAEALLRLRISAVMRRDPHTRADGTYLIRSVYFDDLRDTCLNDNIGGADPRSKYRIRYYNAAADRIQLEKKSKVRGMCLKEACAISREECRSLLRGEIPLPGTDADGMKRRLLTELRLKGLRPVNIVTYERVPFVYAAGNVRVTFDRNLTASAEISRFLDGDYLQHPVFPPGQSLLEVKWDELIPAHLKRTLQTDGLLWTAFSKYSMCRLAQG